MDIKEFINPELKFELVNELPAKGKVGTIYLVGDTEYIYHENKWIEIGRVALATDAEPQEEIEEITIPTNCKNCGAVLEGHVCSYCGTRY